MTNATAQAQSKVTENGGTNHMWNQGISTTPIMSVGPPVKRKRGRPLKYPELNTNHGKNVCVPKRPNHNHGTNTGPKHHSQQICPVGNTSNSGPVIGKEVRGVVDATFDGGYLLSATVGNSTVPLRGVVFKPGHYVPVSKDNDLAPNVPFIKRHNVGDSAQGRVRPYVRPCVRPSSSSAVPDVRALSFGNANHVDARKARRHEVKQTAQPTAPRGRLIISFKNPYGPFPMREPVESYRAGKMTALLKAVEEDMRYKKALPTSQSPSDSATP